MDTTPATQTPLPGVALISFEDGTTKYAYTDELPTALGTTPTIQPSAAPAAQPQPTPQPITIQIVGAQPNLPAVPAKQGPLVEPWMVRGAAGLGLAGGAAALAPVVAEAAASFSSALGSLLHIALQVGGIGLAALVLVRLLAGRKTGSTGGVEVIQTVTQTITNTVRIEK